MKCAILLVLVAVFSHCKAQCVGADGNTYQPGETYKPSDCQFCYCMEGSKMMSCAIQDCAAPPCPNPSHVAGQCCPVCGPDQFPTLVDTSA